jgi:hypothetical protein
MFEDPERQLHPFAHGGTQGGHFGFAPGEQTLVQGRSSVKPSGMLGTVLAQR